ncbi:P-loop ATPase, Sll1717 family [Ferruginibacter sp. SUN106]|uniref:P-loop ATPase, Sll1717 family n=1 Tax=Ferruginibacter sp. SUN106 TaxID=2978348 RepID=UPI003D36F810
MSFFKRLSNEDEYPKGTTRTFFIGTPEAEGETTYNSKIKLGEIFGDYLNVFPELNSEKFIITGRKGAGKSAIAEFIHYSATNDANTFCDFIKTRDLDTNKIVQIGKEEGLPIEEKLLFEWLILTKLIKLLTEDQSVQSIKEFKDLNIFLQRNSGLVDIKNYEVSEIVRNKSLEVNIEYFKRVFTSLFKKDIGIREHKAPFYKLLTPLKEVVTKLLLENVTSENEYFLIFDDLDIGFKESDKNSIESLTNVIRVAKDYNIDLFGKNGLEAKIIILLRDDLKRIIVKHNADTAKIFSSYEIPLVWYEHENFKNNENQVGLKKLINKRIEINFKKEDLDFNAFDPWTSLFKEDQQYNGSSFKFLIDYTFFRPRDLILLFKPLPINSFPIPLTFYNSKTLLNAYVEELMLELKNELSASFNENDISKIFLCLKNLKQRQPLTKTQLTNELKDLGLEYDPELALILLFDYSVIGNFENYIYPAKIYFKHRERREDPLVINFDLQFIYHKALEVYLDKRAI